MSFQFMPLYTGDYLRDTRHLSCSEHGIYICFLMYCWDQKGPLPLEERKLYGICSARSGDEIAAMRRVLEEFFIRTDDGWYNKRVSEEIAKAEAVSSRNREAGLKSASARRAYARERAFNDRSTLGGTPTPTPTPKEEDITTNVVISDRPTVGLVPYEKIVDIYHQTLPELSRVLKLTANRKAMIRARWKGKDAEDLNDWVAYFKLVRRSKFLMGMSPGHAGGKVFRADFEWLIKESNFTKVLEGKYE